MVFEFWIGITSSLVVDFRGVGIISLLLEKEVYINEFCQSYLEKQGRQCNVYCSRL